MDDAPLDEAAELPAGAALEATDAAAVELAINAELPAEAAPLDIIEDAATEVPAFGDPIEEAAKEDATAEEKAWPAEEPPPPPPPPADEAQAQTEAAEVCTTSPV